MAQTIEIIVNTSELTAGTRGASLGPGAIMAAARTHNNPLFGTVPWQSLPDFNHYLDAPVTTPYAKRIDGYAKVFESISGKTAELLKEGKFPLVLAADHGSAAGTIAGIRQAFPEKRLGVVWIDAHGDLHSPYTTPSGNVHGMPLSISLADDNKECAHNTPDAHTVSVWDSLKNHGGISPKIEAKDLVFVAVRDTEAEEEALIGRRQIVNHTVEQLRRRGVAAIVADINEQLSDCDAIYISFDVDAMDPELTSFGTGTPVGNGITPDEARELLVSLAVHPKTVCIEFVEVNPCLDNKVNTMAETALSLVTAVADTLTK
ncbi:MAG TPA: arginase [Fluviicola sp.]|nr:arginase [Fluviicola sp.]